MFNIGQKIKILNIPDNNDCWGIPRDIVGACGIVVECPRRDYRGIPCFRLQICETKYSLYENTNWYFPSPDVDDYASIYGIVVVNRWNPMGYVPTCEPLKLP